MKFLIFAVIVLFQYNKPTLAYKAAVYEYHPDILSNPDDTIRKNLNNYRDFSAKARNQGVNIQVFPEYGLTGIVSNPEDYAIDLNETDNNIIREITTLANEHQTYIVVNLLEKVQERNSRKLYYNTNLVVHKNGSIILKYRKINLYNEPKLTPGSENQTVTFETDFGATFGIFTGYDILFANPSQKVLENSKVAEVVYPTAWNSLSPFFSALSVQHGYSLANGVNLLAANYGNASQGHGGSGIYLNDGKAEVYIGDTRSSKPIVADLRSERADKTQCLRISPQGLPGDPNTTALTGYKIIEHFKSSDYTFKKIDLTQSDSSTTVCDGDLCCTFRVVIDTTNQQSTSVTYKAIAFDGPADLPNFSDHIRICSLIACENDSNDSCGKRVNVTTRFTKLTVEGNLEKEEGTFYRPLSLNYFLNPVLNTIYCDTNNGTNSSYVELTTREGPQSVLVFGIVGRTSAASSVHAYGFLFVVVLSIIKFVSM